MDYSIKKLIHGINASSENSYTADYSNHNQFLERCNELLYQYFSSHFLSNFNFSALSYRNTEAEEQFDFVQGREATWSYNFSKSNLNGVSSLRQLFEDFINEAKEDKTINLTYVLTTQVNTKEIFLAYSDSKNDDRETIQETVSLDHIKWEEDIHEFIKVNKKDIGLFIEQLHGKKQDAIKYARYIQNYKKIFDLYKKENPNRPFYLYFLRPSSLVSNYRILLSLSTSRPISNYDLGCINLILYRIVSQTAIAKFNENERYLKDKLLAQQRAKELESEVAQQKQLMNYVELNTYHHLESNLKNLPKLLDEDSINIEKNLSDRQLRLVSDIKSYIRSLLSNSSSTLKTIRDYVINRSENKKEKYHISSFFAEYSSIFKKKIVLSDNLKIEQGTMNYNGERLVMTTSPFLICSILESQIANMASEFSKTDHDPNQTEKIVIDTIFTPIGDDEYTLTIRISNSFSRFPKDVLEKGGIEPLKRSKSSGLGIYFLNLLLATANANPTTNSKRYVSLTNNDLGACISFSFKTQKHG